MLPATPPTARKATGNIQRWWWLGLVLVTGLAVRNVRMSTRVAPGADSQESPSGEASAVGAVKAALAVPTTNNTTFTASFPNDTTTNDTTTNVTTTNNNNNTIKIITTTTTTTTAKPPVDPNTTSADTPPSGQATPQLPPLVAWEDFVLPPVQAWPDRGDIKPPREFPPLGLPSYAEAELLPSFPGSNASDSQNHNQTTNDDDTEERPTINPVLPSRRKDPSTFWNLEIPPDYSIEAPANSTVPWSNVTSTAFYEGRLRSGFRNQMMAFVILILQAQKDGHGQFLLRSLGQKDTYGTNSFIPFDKLWDVPHWNSHYPRLPRLVDYDPVLHSQFNYDNTRWYRTKDTGSFGSYGVFVTHKPIRPHAFGYQHKLMAAYQRYGIGKGPYAAEGGHRHPAEILMLEGALRPHPDLRRIIEGIALRSGLVPARNNHTGTGYMTLHARVEPDMQKHMVCTEKKVLNLTEVFRFVEEKWPEPPVSRVFMPINRQYLEKEAKINTKKPKKTNWIAIANLEALDRATTKGLWGGRVEVLEFGANALANTTYAKKPSTAGAMLNFFLGIEAEIFVGTEVSSYSHDLLATRFFRGYRENYKYLPRGLVRWTPPGTTDPPGFRC